MFKTPAMCAPLFSQRVRVALYSCVECVCVTMSVSGVEYSHFLQFHYSDCLKIASHCYSHFHFVANEWGWKSAQMCISHWYAGVFNGLCSFPPLFMGKLTLPLLPVGMSSFLIKDIALCPVWSEYFPWFICLASNFERNCNLYIKYLLSFCLCYFSHSFWDQKFLPPVLCLDLITPYLCLQFWWFVCV